MLTFKHTLAPTLLIVALLGGCTSAQPDAAPTATPTPTPTLMSTEEAGAYYLATICPANVAGNAFNTVWVNLDSPYEAIIPVAAASMDANRNAAEALDDTTVIWPENVVEDVAVVRDALLADTSTLSAIANAATLEEMNGISFTDTSDSAAASQRIRLRLDLSADTNVGC